MAERRKRRQRANAEISKLSRKVGSEEMEALRIIYTASRKAHGGKLSRKLRGVEKKKKSGILTRRAAGSRGTRFRKRGVKVIQKTRRDRGEKVRIRVVGRWIKDSPSFLVRGIGRGGGRRKSTDRVGVKIMGMKTGSAIKREFFVTWGSGGGGKKVESSQRVTAHTDMSPLGRRSWHVSIGGSWLSKKKDKSEEEEENGWQQEKT